MSQAKLIYYVAQSLDGYIADKNNGVAWLDKYDSAGEDYGYESFYVEVDSIIMGRKTFDQVLGFGDWPYPSKSSWIVTHKPILKTLPEVFGTDDPPEMIMEIIRKKGFNTTWLVGGGEVANLFLERGLITNYIISLMPELLGDGVSLLGNAQMRSDMKLKSSQIFQNGVIQLHYVKF